MSYELIERSAFEGSPIELYKFVKGTSVYTQTSGNEEITYNGDIFVPRTLKRSEVSLTGEINKSPLTINMARDNEVSELFKLGYPSAPVTISVFRRHHQETDTILLWRGRVSSCSFQDNLANLTCESIFTSIKRLGLFRNYQKSCPHMLFDSSCKVTKLSISGLVDSINGLIITSSTFATQPDGWWVGGIFEAKGDLRYIHKHNGNEITLNRVIPFLDPGVPMSILPGCDRSKDTCISKFNNLDNYGGFPLIPPNNPFGGGGIA